MHFGFAEANWRLRFVGLGHLRASKALFGSNIMFRAKVN
jgi:hypothetical protein